MMEHKIVLCMTNNTVLTWSFFSFTLSQHLWKDLSQEKEGITEMFIPLLTEFFFV